jgi:RHS repeat-associated protein
VNLDLLFSDGQFLLRYIISRQRQGHQGLMLFAGTSRNPIWSRNVKIKIGRGSLSISSAASGLEAKAGSGVKGRADRRRRSAVISMEGLESRLFMSVVHATDTTTPTAPVNPTPGSTGPTYSEQTAVGGSSGAVGYTSGVAVSSGVIYYSSGAVSSSGAPGYSSQAQNDGDPIRTFDGTLELTNTDLESDGFGASWGVMRSWTNNSAYAVNNHNGNGWTSSQIPTLVEPPDYSTTHDLEVISSGSQETTFTEFGTSGVFYDTLGEKDTLTSVSDTYVLTDAQGDQTTFHNFTTSGTLGWGLFMSYQPATGSEITAAYTGGSYGYELTSLSRSETTGSNTVAEQYAYTYYASGANEGELDNVALERSTDGGSYSVVQQVSYTYYQGTYTGSDAWGRLNDLETASIENPSGTVLAEYYYRYYTPSDDLPTGSYTGSLLKYEFMPQEFAQLSSAATADSTTPFLMTNAQAAPYALLYLQYNSIATENIGGDSYALPQVTAETVGGMGSSADGGLGTFIFNYSAGGTPASDENLNAWSYLTTVQDPSGQIEYNYTDYAGLPVVSDNFDVVSSQHSITYDRYDAQGSIVLQAQPSAVVEYDTSYPGMVVNGSGSYFGLSASSGVINVTQYWGDASADRFGRTDPNTDTAGATGYVEDTQVMDGIADSSPAVIEDYNYTSQSADYATIHLVSDITEYQDGDGSGAEVTAYSYSFGSGFNITSIVTALPAVLSTENGSGSSATITDVYDADGNVEWQRDGNGYISYFAYDVATNGLLKSITDVKTCDTASFAPATVPSGLSTPAGGGLNLVTSYQVDFEGRPTKITTPNGNVDYITYDDVNHVTREYIGWTYNSSNATYAPSSPVEVDWNNWAQGLEATLSYSYTPAASSTPADGSGAISGLQSLAINKNNDANQTVETDDYFSLSGITIDPASSSSDALGAAGSNFYQTTYGYNSGGLQDQITDADGTISESVLNNRGWLVQSLIGTSTSNLTDVADYSYDFDGDVTQMVTHPGGGEADRTTTYGYDSRDRVVLEIDGAGSAQPMVETTAYDNLNEVTQTQQYAGSGFAVGTGNVPTSGDASLLRAQSQFAYDELGEVYQQTISSIDPSSGDVADTTANYYDGDGNLIASVSATGLWTKNVFNGADREIASYQTQSGGSSLPDAESVSSDIVLSQTKYVYDGDGNVIETVTADRLPGDSTSAIGSLGNAGGTGGPAARVSYTDSYYDAADRLVATSDVGTDGGAAWTRPSAAPSRSADDLVTSYTYNAAGEVGTATDPSGLVTKYSYNPLGETTQVIADYTNGVPTDSSNQTTDYTYDGDGNVTSMTAVMPSGETSQTTDYVYGVSTTGSAINDADLLSEVEYPDPTTGEASGSQAETYTYNALGQQATYTDRNGTEHSYAYDSLGRLISDSVTFAAGSAVDQTITKLGYAYNDAGELESATSYNSSGGIVNQDVETYDGFGQLASEAQATTGAVDGSTPSVGYTYDTANDDRQTGMTYPDGRTLTYSYGASGSLTSSASQLTSISDGSGSIQSYTYLGLATPVTFMDGNSVELSYVSSDGSTGDAGDVVTGLDRFGRVVAQDWTGPYEEGPAVRPTIDQEQYTYDTDGNVLTRDNTVITGQSEAYSYDGLNRLTGFARGTLSDGAITSPTTTESWTLDALGNWESYTLNGTTVGRTNSAQNQVQTVVTPNGEGGNTTATLGYDADGNTTADQNGQQYVYDAWNRLVEVKNGSGTVVAQFGYDAQGRRVTETEAGVTTSLYYSKDWQVLEEDQSGAVTTQYVWGPFAVDTLVERDDQPVTTDGTTSLTRRLYAEQDADENVTSLTDSTGTVVERYVYNPYGTVTVESADGTVRGDGTAASSSYGWVILNQGLRYDVATGTDDDRNRVYFVSLGRFGQEDPADYINGPSRYQFELSNPNSSLDPSGLATTQPTGAPVTHGTVGPVKARVIGPGITFTYTGTDTPTFQQVVKITLPPGAGPSQEERDSHGGADPTEGYVGDNGSGTCGNSYGSDYYGAPQPGWRDNGSNGATDKVTGDTPGPNYTDDNGVTWHVRKDFIMTVYDGDGNEVAVIHWHQDPRGTVGIDKIEK